jgi:hypothetical protein
LIKNEYATAWLHYRFGCWPALQAQPIQPAETNRMQAMPQQPGQTTTDTNQSLRHMAQSLSSMADMCKTMMQMEMKSHPLKVAALALAGTLLSVALILFIILEIQWIRYFSLRIKSEKTRVEIPR